jgi:hypothetical protein
MVARKISVHSISLHLRFISVPKRYTFQNRDNTFLPDIYIVKVYTVYILQLRFTYAYVSLAFSGLMSQERAQKRGNYHGYQYRDTDSTILRY